MIKSTLYVNLILTFLPAYKIYKIKNMSECHPLPHEEFFYVLTMSLPWLCRHERCYWDFSLYPVISMTTVYFPNFFSRPFSICTVPAVTKTTHVLSPLSPNCLLLSMALMSTANKDWLKNPEKSKRIWLLVQVSLICLLVRFLTEHQPPSKRRK